MIVLQVKMINILLSPQVVTRYMCYRVGKENNHLFIVSNHVSFLLQNLKSWQCDSLLIPYQWSANQIWI